MLDWECRVFYLLYVVTLVSSNYAVHEMKVGKLHTGFEWRNCSTPSVAMVFSSFSVRPDPIEPGSNVTASFVIDITEDIGTTNTLRYDLDLILTTQGTQIDLCSYTPISKYCHVENLCKILAQHRDECTKHFKKLDFDCECPLKRKRYAAKNLHYFLPQVPITGKFHIKANLTESNQVMGCLEVDVCIGSC